MMRCADALSASDDPVVGSVGDIKAAITAVPEAKQTSAFIDLASELGTTDQSQKLLSLTGLALDRATDILRDKAERKSDTYNEDLRAQTSTIKTVLTTQLRVDENHLRRRAVDSLPALLKAVALEEQRLSAARG
jgi:hypothetical protein